MLIQSIINASAQFPSSPKYFILLELNLGKEKRQLRWTYVAVTDVFPTGEPTFTFSSTSRVYSALVNTGGLSLMSPIWISTEMVV